MWFFRYLNRTRTNRMLYLIFLVPFVGGLAAAIFPSNHLRPYLLPVFSAVHLSLVLSIVNQTGLSALQGWLFLDPLGKLVLVVVSILFFACFVYAPSYLWERREQSNRVFCSCLLFFLALLSLVTFSRQLELMWVAIEATSLVCAPLIYFNHNHRSIEAAWKFLLICSVGIALALLGSFFLGYSSLVGGGPTTLMMDDLTRSAGLLSKPWLHAAFAALLVGYGTKMGLAPLHTWLPDAHSESPALVSALLSGALLNCAVLAVLRVTKILHAAGDGAFADRALLGLGLLSIAFGAVFMARQKDFKRMLAYSSVEHMGILALGVSFGGIGIFGSLLHLVNNALTKGMLFLVSGNIYSAYHSKSRDEVSGAIRRLPVSGPLFLAGFIAITGSPPFGPFVSEFTILRASFENHQYVVGGIFLFLLMVVFMGMGNTFLAVCQGEPSAAAKATDFHDSFFRVLSPLALTAMVLLLGVYIPDPVMKLLQDAANYWEGVP
jgi:hydrogenase-4 component F